MASYDDILFTSLLSLSLSHYLSLFSGHTDSYIRIIYMTMITVNPNSRRELGTRYIPVPTLNMPNANCWRSRCLLLRKAHILGYFFIRLKFLINHVKNCLGNIFGQPVHIVFRWLHSNSGLKWIAKISGTCVFKISITIEEHKNQGERSK
jgi:hypothetical protein